MASTGLSRAALPALRPMRMTAGPALRSARPVRCPRLQRARYSTSPEPDQQGLGARTFLLLSLTAAAGAGLVLGYPYLFSAAKPESQKQPQPSFPEPAEIVFEQPRKKAASKEEARDLVSPQHVQVKKSWEHPGVYAWGSNAGRVVAPDSSEPVIKAPRRIPYFDGQLLRDLKIHRDFGVAVTEQGDVVQWGAAFDKASTAPTTTLKGHDITKVAVSRDRIIALSSRGSVYSIPVSKADQAAGEKAPRKSSWLPFWTSDAPAISYRCLQPANLGWGEKVIDVKSGLDHCLLLTSKGRVFAAAASSEDFPSKGQLGVPGLTWHTRPAGPYDQPHEVKALGGRVIQQIAAGDFHSLALDRDGRVFSFGDNAAGQLGFDTGPGPTSTPRRRCPWPSSTAAPAWRRASRPSPRAAKTATSPSTPRGPSPSPPCPASCSGGGRWPTRGPAARASTATWARGGGRTCRRRRPRSRRCRACTSSTRRRTAWRRSGWPGWRRAGRTRAPCSPTGRT
ncbi:hypothetical protein VTJ83DRAFT_3195 [Remersonia thermophila]|uniref:Uncharacterized protein n=1 Tax=Remersonia thermophila TaxID=72144 RepID=A0ABR4DFL4_9PEZI